MRAKEADRVVNVGRCLPPKRNGINGKIPATPFKTKIRATFQREEDMVIARLIIANRLEKRRKNVTRDPTRESSLKGMSLIRRLRNQLSLLRRGLESSTVKGITKCGGGTLPTQENRHGCYQDP